MKSIIVPYLTLDATIQDAMKQMTIANASCVVVEDGNDLWLIKAGDLPKATGSRPKRLVDVDIRQRIPVGRPDSDRTVSEARRFADNADAHVLAPDALVSWGLTSYAFSAVPSGPGQAVLLARDDDALTSLSGAPPAPA